MTQSTRNRRRDDRLTLRHALLAMVTVITAACSETVPGAGEVTIEGRLRHEEDISGIALVGDTLFLASDEGDAVELLDPLEPLRPSGPPGIAPGGYRVSGRRIHLAATDPDDDVELDIEGLESDGDALWVVSSHSARRKRIKPEKSHAENRNRMTDVRPVDARAALFRIGTSRERPAIESISLRGILDDDPILGRFKNVPGKENGVNIESVAVRDGEVFLGLRSPVLRHGYVPVIVMRPEEPERYELRFVNLGGRGIRGMAAVSRGFLLIAGWNHPGDRSSEIVFWNGRDEIPGKGGESGEHTVLGTIDGAAEGTAEGILVLSEDSGVYDTLIVFDGPANGRPTRFEFAVP